MTTGIYCIENLVNGKKYIGKGVDIEGRWRSHKWELKRGLHKNSHLSKAWNLYGEKNFIFYIVEECTLETIDLKEICWIKNFKTFGYNGDYGYNATSGGDSGFLVLEETKKKQRTAKEGIRLSEQHKLNIGLGLIGRVVTEFTRNKIGKSNKKINADDPTKFVGNKNPFYNKSHSEETKKKMSDSRIGKYAGESHWGAKLSENDVINILSLKYDKEIRTKDIMSMYSEICSPASIKSILAGHNWRTVYLKFMEERRNK